MDELQVIYLKLATGKEVIGELVKENNSSFTIRKPMTVTIMERRGIGFFQLNPYSYTAQESLSFNRRFVIEWGEAKDQVIDLYIQHYDDPMESLDEDAINEFINAEFGSRDSDDELSLEDADEAAQEALEELRTTLKGKRSIH